MMTYVSTLITKYKSIDARWLQLTNNCILFGLGLMAFSFSRPLPGIYFGFLLSVLIEFVLSPYFRKDRMSRKHLDRLLSIFNTTVSIVLIMRSSNPWFYAGAIPMATLSKQLITRDGKHIFNPANFGIVAAIAFFSSTSYHFMNNQFILVFSALIVTLTLGILIVIKAERATLAFTYLIATSAILFFAAPSFGFGKLELTGMTFSAAGLLYAFFMLPDPKTTPSSIKAQILFGLATACISAGLRLSQVLHDPFIALFVVTAIYSARPQENNAKASGDLSPDVSVAM